MNNKMFNKYMKTTSDSWKKVKLIDTHLTNPRFQTELRSGPLPFKLTFYYRTGIFHKNHVLSLSTII